MIEQLTYYLGRFAENPANHIIDIVLVTLAIFGIFMLIRGTRAVPLLRGVVILVVLLAIVSVTLINLTASRWLIRTILPALLVAVPVIFQPELRRALEQLGRAGGYFRLFRKAVDTTLVDAISAACQQLSRRREGALIVIEQDTGLQEYIDTGILLKADPSAELLMTIFNKTTELHDGAVIVRGVKFAAAACVLPLSTRSLSDRQMGLRHRAALGISEVSDAVVVVVSEETGQVSIAHNGRVIRRQDPSRLNAILSAFLQGQSGTSS
ncbi:MAG TPA: diadenylate cyclase CdaA [Anaerolineae bacterium]|nr:diadenylate cyclase CdaA [Anaerolineae bacterium]